MSILHPSTGDDQPDHVHDYFEEWSSVVQGHVRRCRICGRLSTSEWQPAPDRQPASEFPPVITYLWQWHDGASSRWLDYSPEWPAEKWARVNHPGAYSSVPDDLTLRLVKRTVIDEALS